MANENVNSASPCDQESGNVENKSTVETNGNSQETAENQTLSKRQRKKLLKHQKREEERELRK